MIIGVTEKLERYLGRYREKDSDMSFASVMNCLTDSVAAGDCWHVPVELLPDGMNETDIEDGHGMEELPMFRKMILSNREGEIVFFAFTSEEAMNADRRDGTRISVKYSARALLTDLLADEEIAGVVINPWTEAFRVSRVNIEKVLERADRMSAEKVAALRSYRLEPKALIDTNEMLEGWREGWHDEEDLIEPWKLVCYPIMPDGHILLTFAMRGEIHGGHVSAPQVIHTLTNYRVLEVAVENGRVEVLNKYRFKMQDSYAASVFLHDGVLSAVVSTEDSDRYDVLQMVPNDDDRQYTVYRDAESIVVDSKGNVVVAYGNNLRDPARCPVMVFNRDGEVTVNYQDEAALACLDVNLDREERVWCHLHPSAVLDMLDEESECVRTHRVALQGFRAFALSSDCSKLYACFTEHGGGSAHYVMTADENGDYVCPMRFEFLPEDGEGNILEAKDCEVFGRPSTMKSWVLLNADGRLYLYDIDDCCDTE